MKLFYSWQSDTPSNRGLIQKCIREALKAVPQFELETATRDALGSPDIASTILQKIDDSNMIIADVSIINSGSRKTRPVPNPNVTYELGYALKSLGEENVILVADKSTTNTANLPFDIRNRRMILLDFSKLESEKQIVAAIVAALNGHRPKGLVASQTAPQAFLSQPEATWASNYGGYGASFRVVVDVDNYGGKNDYITDAKMKGTNANGTSYSTDRFTFEREQMNQPHSIAADEMQRLAVFVSDDYESHRAMPDLDRDTVSLLLRFRSGKALELPIKIRQS
jgi:hypothetical protein